MTKMTWKQAIEESIAHWKRMIAWVNKRSGSAFVDPDQMYKSLGETWGSSDCPLCERASLTEGMCDNCPLARKYGSCGDEDEKNVWQKVAYSTRWVEWLRHARQMLRQLKSLRKTK